jgi:hypothetical protein
MNSSYYWVLARQGYRWENSAARPGGYLCDKQATE